MFFGFPEEHSCDEKTKDSAKLERAFREPRSPERSEAGKALTYEAAGKKQPVPKTAAQRARC